MAITAAQRSPPGRRSRAAQIRVEVLEQQAAKAVQRPLRPHPRQPAADVRVAQLGRQAHQRALALAAR